MNEMKIYRLNILKEEIKFILRRKQGSRNSPVGRSA